MSDKHKKPELIQPDCGSAAAEGDDAAPAALQAKLSVRLTGSIDFSCKSLSLQASESCLVLTLSGLFLPLEKAGWLRCGWEATGGSVCQLLPA